MKPATGWEGGTSTLGGVGGSGGQKEDFFVADPSANLGSYHVRSVSGTGAHRFTMRIPNNAKTVTSIVAVGFTATALASANIDLFAEYGAVGELYNQNSVSNVTSTYTRAINTLIEIDMTTLLSGIAAGDMLGVEIDHLAIGGTIHWMGFRVGYTT